MFCTSVYSHYFNNGTDNNYCCNDNNRTNHTSNNDDARNDHPGKNDNIE